MNLTSDQHRALCTSVLLVLLVALVAMIVWTAVPLQSHTDTFDLDSVFSAPSEQTLSSNAQSRTITPSMFDANLWYTPPVVALPETKRPEPQPVTTHYQLMAITHQVVDAQQLHFAVLYDPNADLVHRVARGDRLGALVVSDITNTEVTMQQGQRITVLRLDDSEPQS